MGIDLTLIPPPQAGGPAAASRLPARPGGPARDHLAPKGREFGDIVTSLAVSGHDRPACADARWADSPVDTGEAHQHGTAGEPDRASADLVFADDSRQSGALELRRVVQGAFGRAPTGSQLPIDQAVCARGATGEPSGRSGEEGEREGESTEDTPARPGSGPGVAAFAAWPIATHLADAATPVDVPGEPGSAFHEEVDRAGPVGEDGQPTSAPGAGLAPSGPQLPGRSAESAAASWLRPPLEFPPVDPPDAAAAAPDPGLPAIGSQTALRSPAAENPLPATAPDPGLPAIASETAPGSPTAQNPLPAADPIAGRLRSTPDTEPSEPGRSRSLTDLLRGLVAKDDGATRGATREGETGRSAAAQRTAIVANGGHASLAPPAGLAEVRGGPVSGRDPAAARGATPEGVGVGVPVEPRLVNAGVRVPDGAVITNAAPVAHPAGGARAAWQARLAETLTDQSPGWTVAPLSGGVAHAERPDRQVSTPTAPASDAVTAPESWPGPLAGTAAPTSATSAVAAHSLWEAAAPANGLADDQGIVPQVVKAIHLQWRQGLGEARLRLDPAHLGEVQVTLRVQDGAVSALLRAETPAVQAWIDARQQDLRGALEHLGLRLEHFEVVVDPDGRREPTRDQLPFTRPRAIRTRAGAPRFEVDA